MAKYTSSSRSNSKIGKTLSFYDVKTGKKTRLPVAGVRTYSLAKKRNSRRSRGRCSIIAYAHKGSRKLWRIVGNVKCRKSSSRKRSSKKRSKGTRSRRRSRH